MNLANKINTILCDDIRFEQGNRYSLMGIYANNLIFPKFPAVIPKISLAIILEGVKVNLKECRVSLKTPETEPLISTIQLAGEKHIGQNITIFAAFAPFAVKTPGPAKLEVRFDKRKAPIIHKFEIQRSAKQ